MCPLCGLWGCSCSDGPRRDLRVALSPCRCFCALRCLQACCLGHTIPSLALALDALCAPLSGRLGACAGCGLLYGCSWSCERVSCKLCLDLRLPARAIAGGRLSIGEGSREDLPGHEPLVPVAGLTSWVLPALPLRLTHVLYATCMGPGWFSGMKEARPHPTHFMSLANRDCTPGVSSSLLSSGIVARHLCSGATACLR